MKNRRRTRADRGRRTRRIGPAGWAGLLIGLAAAAPADRRRTRRHRPRTGPPQPPPTGPPPPFTPTEHIDVEQAIDFPYDI